MIIDNSRWMPDHPLAPVLNHLLAAFCSPARVARPSRARSNSSLQRACSRPSCPGFGNCSSASFVCRVEAQVKPDRKARPQKRKVTYMKKIFNRENRENVPKREACVQFDENCL